MRSQANFMTPVTVEVELRIPSATVQIIRKNSGEPDRFRTDVYKPGNVYWVELSLAPRRPDERARYVDIWSAHRYTRVGAVLMMSPDHAVQFEGHTWPQTTLVCQLHADAVRSRFQMDFEWTDRQLEACLDIANPVIHDLLRRLAHELRHPDASSETLAEALAVQLSIEIGRFCVGFCNAPEAGGLSSWRLRTIDRRLAAGGDSPTLQELASLCGISVRQLTRGFRTSRGCSIGDHMAQTRIEMVKRQLKTDESITSIARAMGFSSPSNFSHSFHRATGLTPTQYRNLMMGADEHNFARLAVA